MIRRLALLFVLYFCTACGINTSDISTKFITPSTTPGNCNGQAVSNQFLVRWYDGTTTLEHATSREDFIKGFLTEHKDEVDFAEHNYKIKLDPLSTATVEATDV